MIKGEIIKEKVKRIIQRNDKPKIEFLTILVCHNGSIMSDSIPISSKQFKEKYGERKFDEVRDELIDEGIISTSTSGGVQLAVKKEGYYDHQKGEELSRFIGKLVFETSPRIKKTIEKITEELEGKEFLRNVSEEKGIHMWNGKKPEIIEIIGKRSYEEILRNLLEVGILTEYAWSSRKHHYHGYKLLPSVETYLKEKLSPFELSTIEKELKVKGLSGSEIYRCLESLRKIYVGQNIRSEGILQSDFSKYGKEIELLTKYEFINENKWFRFDLFLTTESGSKTGKLLVENLIRDKQAQITSAVLSLPHNLIGFLLFDYMAQSSAYPVDKEHPFDWREPLLADSRVWILRNNLLSKLEELGLCIRTRSYVSTRGGELRGEYYVTCKEVLDFLKDCTAYKGGLFGKEKKLLVLYGFLSKAKRFLQIEDINEVRQRYYNEMETSELTEEEIDDVVNEMTKNGICTQYEGLLSNKRPFSIKDESRYDIYLKENLVKPVTHFMLSERRLAIDIEKETVAEERSEEVRRMEKREMRSLGLLSKGERLKFYDDFGDFELELREFIKTALKRKFGLSWIEKAIPPKMRKKWNDRKKEEIEEGIEPEQEIMNYADFLDYRKIIISNWKVFQSYFSEKEKKFLEVRFNDINFLGRRPIMHVRNITREKIGVTMHAINWLLKRIECSKVEEELR